MKAFIHTAIIIITGLLLSCGNLLSDALDADLYDGTVGPWSDTTSFSTSRRGHCAVSANGYIYLMGGSNNTGDPLSDVQYTKIIEDGSLDAWQNTTALPSELNGLSCHAIDDNVYIVGGTASNTVYYSHSNADGTLGDWTATSSFNTNRNYHASVIAKGYMYIIGGYTSATPYASDVQYAKINADGTLGTWKPTTSLDTGRYGHTAVAVNGYIYVIGGTYASGEELDEVQYARINDDGSLGPWINGTDFPTIIYQHASITKHGYIYVIGGSKHIPFSIAYFNTVYYAAVNRDGSIGEWKSTNPFADFANGRCNFPAVINKDYLYAFGGYADGFYSKVSYSYFNE